MPTTLFISDLHLDDARPRINALFLGFVAGPAARAEALYILGDLFEFWLGDDALDLPPFRAAVDALAELSHGGTRVYFMHGNRDFLVREGFAAAAGATLLADPTEVDLYGRRTLLMHGDTLCTDDIAYQQFRARVRDPREQAAFLARTVAERSAIVSGVREQSDAAKAGKSIEIMDVSPRAVEEVLRRHGYPTLIHGHTHRPATHVLHVDGHRCERWVLPDWYERGGYLEVTPEGWTARAIAA
jgi:UDP-2,3-diacylglucosamine hydrolase